MSSKINDLISRSPLRYNSHQSSQFRREELTAFAEVIIRECMDLADRESREQETSIGTQAADEIWYRIKNNFGIN